MLSCEPEGSVARSSSFQCKCLEQTKALPRQICSIVLQQPLSSTNSSQPDPRPSLNRPHNPHALAPTPPFLLACTSISPSPPQLSSSTYSLRNLRFPTKNSSPRSTPPPTSSRVPSSHRYAHDLPSTLPLPSSVLHYAYH